MYVDYYNLRGPPFRLNPDHRFFYVAEPHRKAVAHLKYALSQQEGFVVITGEVGAGKTTLVNHMLSDLAGSRCVTGTVVTTSIEHEDLIRLVAAAFGLRHEPVDKATHLLDIRAFLDEQHEIGRSPVLFVDEAQNLPASSLEELRMLSNFCLPGEALLQIFLVGQPQFKSMLAHPGLEQLRQRVITSCHLGALHEEDTRNYVLHRLRRTGWHGDPDFSDRAFELVHLLSGGIPRRINLLCDRLLLYGYLEQSHRIDAATVSAVAQDMTEEGLMTVSPAFLSPDGLLPLPEDGLLSDEPGPAREGASPGLQDAQAEPPSPPPPDEAAKTEGAGSKEEVVPAATGDDVATGTITLLPLASRQTTRQPDPPQGATENPEQPAQQPALAPAALGPDHRDPEQELAPPRMRGRSARLRQVLVHSVLAAAAILAVVAVPRGLLQSLAPAEPGSSTLAVIEMKENNGADSAADIAQPESPAPLPPEVAQKSDQEKPLSETFLIPASNAPEHGTASPGEAPAEPAPALRPSSRPGGAKLEVRQLAPRATTPKSAPSEPAASQPDVSGPANPEPARPVPAVPARKPLQLAAAETGPIEDRFLIQLAALRSRGEASQLREQLMRSFGDLLGDVELQVRTAEIAGIAFYRVQSDAGTSRARAERICTGFSEQGQDCILIPVPSAPPNTRVQ